MRGRVDFIPQTRVLLVEDHELIAESVRRALNTEPDVDVVGCEGTVEAGVRAATDVRPDVVVMDYRLPDGTGAEAAARIKALLPETQIVMLTGSATAATLADALRAGCSGFVSKESHFDELVSTIRAVVAGELRLPQCLVNDLAAHLRPRASTLGDDLSTRELEVLQLLASGASTPEIVDTLMLSVHTVRNHIRNIMAKLQVSSRLQAVALATRLGIVPTQPMVNRAST
jgi:DNA-binding NarL/FixJ family response regulator